MRSGRREDAVVAAIEAAMAVCQGRLPPAAPPAGGSGPAGPRAARLAALLVATATVCFIFVFGRCSPKPTCPGCGGHLAVRQVQDAEALRPIPPGQRLMRSTCQQCRRTEDSFEVIPPPTRHDEDQRWNRDTDNGDSGGGSGSGGEGGGGADW
jgi:uncharacterized membrane protein YgcG